jgi:hypothetical protein
MSEPGSEHLSKAALRRLAFEPSKRCIQGNPEYEHLQRCAECRRNLPHITAPRAGEPESIHNILARILPTLPAKGTLL